MRVQYRNVPPWSLRVIRIVCPSVDANRRGMSYQIEYLHNPIPYGMSLVRLFHGNAFYVRRLSVVQSPDYVSQFRYITVTLCFLGNASDFECKGAT